MQSRRPMYLWHTSLTSNNWIPVRKISQLRTGGTFTLNCLDKWKIFCSTSFLSRYGYINGSSSLANCSIAERAQRMQEAKVRSFLLWDSSLVSRKPWLCNETNLWSILTCPAQAAGLITNRIVSGSYNASNFNISIPVSLRQFFSPNHQTPSAGDHLGGEGCKRTDPPVPSKFSWQLLLCVQVLLPTCNLIRIGSLELFLSTADEEKSFDMSLIVILLMAVGTVLVGSFW